MDRRESARSAFRIAEINIPHTVKIIDYSALLFCIFLRKVGFANGLETIEERNWFLRVA